MADTSKHDTTTETYGTNGCFLAALSALSLLTITSRHFTHHSQSTLTLSRHEVIARQLPAPPEQHISSRTHGTRVIVRDIFGDMPVRVKQRAVDSTDPGACLKEWESLRKDIAAILLASPRPVTITLRGVGSYVRSRVLRIASSPTDLDEDVNLLSHIRSILYQSSFISSPDSSSWVSAAGSTSSICLRSGICLDPAPTKNIQFMSLGIKPIANSDGRNILYEEVNRLFANSSFGLMNDLPELDEREKRRREGDRRFKATVGGLGYTNKELKGSGKGVDRWPMFYMRIEMKENERKQDVDNLFDNGEVLNLIIRLLQAVVVEFLKSNRFMPKHIPRERSPKKRERDDMLLGQHGLYGPGRKEGEGKGVLAPPSPKPEQRSDIYTRGSAEDRGNSPLTRAVSPFDGWQRVKSGRTLTAPAIPKSTSLPKGDDAATSKRQSEAPAVQGTPNRPPPGIEPDSMVSKTGTILRLPFLDVARGSTPRRASSRTPTPVPPSEKPNTAIQVFALQTPVPQMLDAAPAIESTESPILQHEKDDIISWIDPITKNESHINKRTGLMVSVPVQVRPSSDPTFEPRKFFRPSSRISRRSVISSATPSNPEACPASPFLASLLQNYHNPIFKSREEDDIPVVSAVEDEPTHSILHGHRHNCNRLDIDKAFKVGVAGEIGRLSKHGLQHAEIIKQVDAKFILINIIETGGRKVLVIVDQHAADERIRVEALMEEFFQPPSLPDGHIGIAPGVRIAPVEKTIRFEIDAMEGQKLDVQKQYFANWGIMFDIRQTGRETSQVIITALPPGIIERCKLDPKLAIELIRKELYVCLAKGAGVNARAANPEGQPHWLERVHNCPRGIVDMLNSRACRSAVMFNDELSVTECQELVRKLGETKFPFFCAHGRPSMIPLVELGAIGTYGGVYTGNTEGFGKSWNRWRMREDSN